MNLFRRLLETWRNRRRFRPRGAERAGRLAELRAGRALRDRLVDTPVEVLAARRIPDHVTGRRREFDFLVAAHDRVVAIELKQWVGEVEVRDGRIVQIRANGERVDHGRLFDSLDDRLRTLESFLDGRLDDVPPLRSFLVFGHPDIHLPDDLPSGEHDVFVLDAPDSPVPSQGREDALAAGFRKLLDRTLDVPPEETDELTPAVADALEALRTAGTWDVVSLYGGRQTPGDLESVVAPDHELSDRSHVADIDLEVDRSYLHALSREPRVRAQATPVDGGENEPVELSLDATATFRPAGTSETVDVPLRNATSLSFGYRERLEKTVDWDDLRTGERHYGRIENVVEFGLFVDLGAPTDGLVHISNVDRGHTSEGELFRRFDEGDTVDVRVTGLRPEDDEIDLHLVHHNPSSI